MFAPPGPRGFGRGVATLCFVCQKVPAFVDERCESCEKNARREQLEWEQRYEDAWRSDKEESQSDQEVEPGPMPPKKEESSQSEPEKMTDQPEVQTEVKAATMVIAPSPKIKFTDYVVVRDDSPESFTAKVNFLLKKGYVLVGSIAIIPASFYRVDCVQALALPAEG